MNQHGGFDAIVIGSGFGGVLAAWPLVHSGRRVLMIERGDWVARGPQNWAPDGVRELSPHYDQTTPYTVCGDDRGKAGALHCVGGGSVFYGGVSLRFRENDFTSSPEEAAAGAVWPFDYAELEPYYAAAESLIGVAGTAGADATEPWRSTPYPQSLPGLSRIGCRIADAASRLGLTPFRLPLAINYTRQAGRNTCVGCAHCDCYPCAISAKNDLASALLPELLAHGLHLAHEHAVTRLVVKRSRVTGVQCSHTRTGQTRTFAADLVILAAGALATPHILISSELQAHNPAGRMIGHFLTRHCNAVVMGIFARALDPAREFHKQIGINDLYFGDPSGNGPAGKLGTLQQIHGPPPGLVTHLLPGLVARFGLRLLDRMTGMIAIAADQPQYRNRVEVGTARNRLGMPEALVHHTYTRRDRQARATLARTASAVLREAGAVITLKLPVRTFSHALGTVRMGNDPAAAPLAADGAFRGIDNLYITDGSALPTPAGVNPSLTIAALALRTSCLIAGLSPAQQIRHTIPARRSISLEVIHV
ncbi:MAG: GMC family oxidoreductase [Gemmatimonadota bacterium]